MINSTMKYGTFKLISGEEIISEYYVDDDKHIVLSNPVQIHRSITQHGPVLSVSHWLMFADKNNFKIKTDRIVALSPKVEDNALAHYMNFVQSRGEHVMASTSEKQEEFYSQLEAKIKQLREDGLFDEELFETPDANTTIH
jgi:hypothetical protein|tara:strand:- start:34 stop:456 length:423 start_codon:yes stop_codon:yes gene_type:complete